MRGLLKSDFANLSVVNTQASGGTTDFFLTLRKEEIRSLRDYAVDQSLETIRNRIDQLSRSWEPRRSRRSCANWPSSCSRLPVVAPWGHDANVAGLPRSTVRLRAPDLARTSCTCAEISSRRTRGVEGFGLNPHGPQVGGG